MLDVAGEFANLDEAELHIAELARRRFEDLKCLLTTNLVSAGPPTT